MEVTRPTVCVVNLDHLTYNLRAIQARVKPSKTMAIVKANAYGHGLEAVALHLQKMGVDQLGVAFLEEGVALRQAGVTLPILVLGGIYSTQISSFLEYDLNLTVSSADKLKQVENIAAQKGRKAQVHLKIDTGMERVGVHSYSSKSFLEQAARSKWVIVNGIYSHLASSDDPHSPTTLNQLERYLIALQHWERLSLPMPLRHLANSGAILHEPKTFLDMTRPGIMLYGVYPDHASLTTVPLKPVLTLRSTVVYFKVVEANTPVSYGGTWQTDHPVRMVTIPIGYGDGYRRGISGKGSVLLRGRRYPIVGRICMDQFMVNIEWETAYNGDEVILIGEQGAEQITVADLAKWADTIPYEILTGLNERIPRVYLKS